MSEIFAGVDLGGTKTACVFAGADGKIVAQRRIATQSYEGPQAVIRRIAELVKELSSETGVRPAAVGMGVPGLADLATGTTRFLPNMPTQWRDVGVREVLAPLVGCEVLLLNDARAATLAELVFGHGRQYRDMVFFTLGTGIGGGVVIDGKLRLGALGAAGELGHTIVEPDGPLCGCGNRGCLETLASGPALTAEGVRLLLSGLAPELHRITGGNTAAVNPKTMAEAAGCGDKTVKAAIGRVATYLGIASATMISALHPQAIVFSGGMAAMGAVLIDAVRDAAVPRVGMFPAQDVRFMRSELGDDAGVLGAVALAMRAGI
jgi:glucokinase